MPGAATRVAELQNRIAEEEVRLAEAEMVVEQAHREAEQAHDYFQEVAEAPKVRYCQAWLCLRSKTCPGGLDL